MSFDITNIFGDFSWGILLFNLNMLGYFLCKTFYSAFIQAKDYAPLELIDFYLCQPTGNLLHSDQLRRTIPYSTRCHAVYFKDIGYYKNGGVAFCPYAHNYETHIDQLIVFRPPYPSALYKLPEVKDYCVAATHKYFHVILISHDFTLLNSEDYIARVTNLEQHVPSINLEQHIPSINLEQRVHSINLEQHFPPINLESINR